MLTRCLELILAAALMQLAAGCQTGRTPPPAIPPAAEQFPLGKLTIDLPSFRTLEELKAWGKPHDETEAFFLFEKGAVKVAFVVPTWGSGDHWNAVMIYAFDNLQSQWIPHSVWDTQARGVRASFDKRDGMIDVRSGRGVLIFRTNISALAARRTREW